MGESPASRGRGLKPARAFAFVAGRVVARFTRAWIETGTIARRGCEHYVARFTRAWIETNERG